MLHHRRWFCHFDYNGKFKRKYRKAIFREKATSELFELEAVFKRGDSNTHVLWAHFSGAVFKGHYREKVAVDLGAVDVCLRTGLPEPK